MSTLIERLRSDGADCSQNDCDEAADTIERLTKWQAKNRSAIARASNAEADVERLTADLKATEANEQVLVDANKPLLVRITKLERVLDAAKKIPQIESLRKGGHEFPELVRAIAEVET